MSEQLSAVTPPPACRKRKVGKPPTLPAPTNLVEARLFCGEVASRKGSRPSQVKAATVILESFERAAEKEIERLTQELETKATPIPSRANDPVNDPFNDVLAQYRDREMTDLKSENDSLRRTNLRLISESAELRAKLDRILQRLKMKSASLWNEAKEALEADDLERAERAKSDAEVGAEILTESAGTHA
jgi:hypothetical protein